MPRKKQIKANELKGINIYQDPKHGTILYDWITKKGYQLTSSDTKWYIFSEAFLPISIVIVYVSYSLFNVLFINSIIFGLIAYLVMRLIYRVKFLNTLPAIDNYKIPNNGNIFTNAASNYSKTRLLILLILSVALLGVTIAYLVTNKAQSNDVVGIVLLLIAASVLFIFSLVTYIIKNKQK